MRKTILINGALNAKIVGQKAATIAKLAGVTVPEETKILIGEVTSVDLSEEFAHEKLSPVSAMYRAADLEDAFAKAQQAHRRRPATATPPPSTSTPPPGRTWSRTSPPG